MASRRKAEPGVRPSLTEAAVDVIRERILDLTLAPGSRIDDRILAEQFNLSRTPAREALNRLTAEGLVVIQASKGAYVRSLDLMEVGKFFDAYHVGERMLGHFADLADPRLADDLAAIQDRHERAVAANRFAEVAAVNAEFHVRLADSSGNEYVRDFCGRLHNHARRLAYLVYKLEARAGAELPGQQKRIVAEHRRMIALVRSRDREGLIRGLAAHAARFQDRVTRIVACRHAVPLTFD